MILSHEAQATLLLLSRRKQQDPTLEFWGKSESGDWTCLACNTTFPAAEMVQHDETPRTHVHGLECLKNHGLLVFI